MNRQQQWSSVLFLVCAAGAASVVLSRLHSAAPSPFSFVPAQTVTPLPASSRVLPTAAAAKSSVSAPSAVPLSPLAAMREKQRQQWGTRSPGGVLPYLYAPSGLLPGPAKQTIAGYALSVQASDSPNPLGQPASAASSHPAQLCVLLNAVTTAALDPKHPWELNENGLSYDRRPDTSTEVSTAGFLPGNPTGQSATIILSPYLDKGVHPKQVILRGILRQSEDYPEVLTFHTPAVYTGGGAPQAPWQSQETPSGVKVTLPSIALTNISGSDSSTILNLSFIIDPPQTPVLLARSPLCQKYHQPVLLRVGAMTPSGAAYDYPFSDPRGVMSLYKSSNQAWQYGPSPDVLTLVVQQRVYVRQIPFALRVSVSHRPFQRTR